MLSPVRPTLPLPTVSAQAAVRPPPIPVVAGFEKHRVLTAADEEREWDAVIAGVKAAADAADEWDTAIEKAKARADGLTDRQRRHHEERRRQS